MAAITSTVGAFSGINTGDIIDKLMTIEKQPYEKLTTKKKEFQTDISSYGEVASNLSSLKAALANIQSKKLNSYTASSSDAQYVKVTADTGASAGQYGLKVAQLAQEEKLYSQAFSSTSDVFNSGTITVSNGGHSTTITLDYSNKTLSGIRDAINSAATDVSATILHDSTGYRLMLSSRGGSTSSPLSISVSDAGGSANALDAFTYDPTTGGNMTLLQYRQDAQFSVDGFQLTSPTNRVSNAVSGLTFDLVNPTSNRTVTVTVNPNSISTSDNMKTFVEAYNNTLAKLKELTAKGQPLQSDGTIRTIINSMRNVFISGTSSSSVAVFGIAHNKDGTLAIDSTKMDTAISRSMVNFYKSINSFSSSFTTTLTNILTNTLSVKNDTINTQIRQIDDKQSSLSDILDKKRAAYVKKFAAMEQAIADMQSQSQSLNNITRSSTTSK
ncbi:MAG: flagellar filament capping protein FliD [Nitrospirae bacterium YQR-1]